MMKRIFLSFFILQGSLFALTSCNEESSSLSLNTFNYSDAKDSIAFDRDGFIFINDTIKGDCIAITDHLTENPSLKNGGFIVLRVNNTFVKLYEDTTVSHFFLFEKFYNGNYSATVQYPKLLNKAGYLYCTLTVVAKDGKTFCKKIPAYPND